MKHEQKKQEKEVYGVKTKPCVVDVPAQKYVIISGNGSSNGEIFSDEVVALSLMAYKTKMAWKALTERSNEITDYTVCPLEGIWSTAFEREYLVKEKLHKEVFDDKPTSFEIMDRYCMEHSCKRMEKGHHEIYLNNANHAEKAGSKIILGYKVIGIEKLQHTAIKEERR